MRIFRIVPLALLAGALGVGLTGCGRRTSPGNASGVAEPGDGPRVGSAAPEIEGVDADNQTFRLSDYRGKVVLLTFWHSS